MTAESDGLHLTLEQIGKRAGVSRSTVSRVLNGQRDVRPEVRARVEAVIAETGYHPNPAARALVSKRSGLIGLVMLTEVDELFGDPYYSALVNGIQLGCTEHDLISAIFPAPGPGSQPEALTPQIAQRFVDGVIITAVPQSGPMIEALRARRKRMVVIGHPADEADLIRIDVTNRAGSAAAVAHLVDHGRRSIAYLGPPPEYPFGVDRLAGYRDGMAAAGLDGDALVHIAEPSVAGGHDAATALLADDEPDAIFAATDTMAERAYRALAERGLRVPDDVAVVGFDGLPRGAVLDPVLTTVVQPVVEVGRQAVGLLASDEPESVVLPTALRLGASCGRH